VSGVGHVPGEGPDNATVMLIGEAPGYYESIEHRPFVGKSGRELTTYLDRAHLYRDSVYVTNLVKYQPPYVNGKQQPPSREDIERDTPELLEELLRYRPRWIGAIGRYAARFLTSLDLSMESAHGLAFPLGGKIRDLMVAGTGKHLQASGKKPDRHVNVESSVPVSAHHRASGRNTAQDERHSRYVHLRPMARHAWLDHCTVVPLYHVAAGLHNPEIAPLVWWDIRQFAAYVSGRLTPLSSVDEHPTPRYDVFTDSMRRRDGSWIGTDIRSLFGTPPPAVAIDTEGWARDPISLQISARPGTGYVIRAEDRRELDMLAELLRIHTSVRIVGHNWLHDLDVSSALGIDLTDGINWDRVEDTMLMLFCLRLLPLGLKPISLRLSGAVQRDYAEVIAPAEKRMTLRYVTRAIDARTCATCGGTGKVAAYGKSGAKRGQLLKRQDPCPNSVCVDGGLWPRREGQLAYDWSKGTWKITYGWDIQRYLRRLRDDLNAGVFDDTASDGDDTSAEDEGAERKPKTIRQRWDSWDGDVRGPVEAAIGAMPEATLRDVDPGEFEQYAARDADITLRNYPKIRAMIDELDLYPAYRLDMDVIPVAAEMQRNGMPCDVGKLRKLSRRLKSENDVLLAKLQHLAHRPINPASGDQVAALLFGERRLTFTDDDARDLQPVSFDLESEKRTPTGKRASTDDKVLEGLKLKYANRADVVEVVQLILDYRMRHKIITTYADKIPRIIDADGYVHTRIRPTTAATFRWASGDPINLQNIPIRNKGGADLGRMVRGCFVAPDGWVLGSADYSQVELRILAALSGDDNLLRAFREGLDPHVLGASRAWKIPYDELYAGYKAGDRKCSDIRDSAKNLNFGIVFGITPRGLQAQMELRGLKYTLDECAQLIHMWLHETFPGIGSFIQETHEMAKREGLTRTVMGHIRYAPAVWSSTPSIREEALRQLVNFRIQGTAAEVLKAGLRDLWRRGKSTLDAVGTRILMSVHDENLFLVRDNDTARGTTAMVVETYMENPIPLPNGIEITTAMKFADNWGALK
jgi:uracil-DNA glycosylase family 4